MQNPTATIYQLIIKVYEFLPFKKQLCLLMRFLKIPNSKFYKDLKFEGKFVIKLNDRKFYLTNYKDTLENEVFWKGINNGWEKETLKLWKEKCTDAKVIFDIGANTGLFGIIGKVINPESIIFSFEPSKGTYKKLINNIRINVFKDFFTYNFAISNINGTADFYDFNTTNQYSASLNKEMSSCLSNDKINKYEILTKTIDAFIEENNIKRVDLIKIDVEMHEPEVLLGFEKYIKIFMPVIFIEILNNDIALKIEKILDSFSVKYDYYNIDESSGAIKTDHLIISRTLNYMLIPKTNF